MDLTCKTIKIPFTELRLRDGIAYDFQIKTRDGNVVILLVSKNVISEKPIFYMIMEQHKKVNPEKSITIGRFTSTVMEALDGYMAKNMFYLYPAFHEIAPKLIYAAEHYHIPNLVDECLEIILETFSIENVLKSLDISKFVIDRGVRIRDREMLYDKCLFLIFQ